jgi:hypothetical protein
MALHTESAGFDISGGIVTNQVRPAVDLHTDGGDRLFLGRRRR